tara:strand:+ start:2486 stop:3154 length:669 start_codon:yes stop_codon:yes gene_type:complete
MNLSTSSIPVSLGEGILILFLSTIAGLIIRYFFYKYGDSMSSRKAFGNTILLITISVASLIAVVKSSLALSLGLVGALSVVRFRTAVKEPFNLAFILLAICIGISIGASQFLFALLITILGCLVTVSLSKYSNRFNNPGNVDDLDSISISLKEGANLDLLYSFFNNEVETYNIKNFTENSNGEINITFRVSISNIKNLEKLRKNIRDNFGGSEFAFYETPGR